MAQRGGGGQATRRELSILKEQGCPLWDEREVMEKHLLASTPKGSIRSDGSGSCAGAFRSRLMRAHDQQAPPAIDTTPGFLRPAGADRRSYSYGTHSDFSDDESPPPNRTSVLALDLDSLVCVIGFLTWDVLTMCLEVSRDFYRIARSALPYAEFPSCIYTTARQSLHTDWHCTSRRVRGLDCLDPDSYTEVSFVPYRFKICPCYGPYRNRRLTFVHNYDSFVCQCVLLHPFGKIVAGKTHFYVSSSSSMTNYDPLQYLVALLHMSPGCVAHDTSLYNCHFKVVNPAMTRRADMFITQGDSAWPHFPTPLYSYHHEVKRFLRENNSDAEVVLDLPDFVCVAEAKCALREHLELDHTQAVVFVSSRCTTLDDWEDQPHVVTYLVVDADMMDGKACPVGIQGSTHLSMDPMPPPSFEPSSTSRTIRVKLLSPDICLSGDVMLNMRQNLGVVKKNVLRCADDGNGIVMLQSRPGVVLEEAHSRGLETYASNAFQDGALVVAYLATTFAKVHIFTPMTLCESRIVLAVHKKWTVKTFLAVLMAAMRRLSQYPPAETEWCTLSGSGNEDLIPFPTRISLFSAKVSIGCGPYLTYDSYIHDYWEEPTHQQHFRVEVCCGTGREE